MDKSIIDVLAELFKSYPEYRVLFLARIPLLMLGSFVYGYLLSYMEREKGWMGFESIYWFSTLLLLVVVIGFIGVTLSFCPRL